MWFRGSFILVAALLVTPSRLSAAAISVFPLKNSTEAMIVVEGELLRDDSAQFRAKVSPFSKAIVVLRSDGGSLLAGIEIGRIIRLRNFITWVPSGVRCASACAAAWLGGSRRLMGKDALIGFHAAYRSRHGIPTESAPANAVLGAYLRDLGLSDRAIVYITSTSPLSMTWLSLSDAMQLGIEVSTFDPDRKSASPNTSPQRQLNVVSQLERRSAEFIATLYRITSGPNSEAIAALNRLYADPVLYFGKRMSRGEVIAHVQRFIARWPVRRYVPKNDTFVIDCDESLLTCTIKGQVQFDAQSSERNERSTGLATFEYSLRFRSLEQTPEITVEGGTVLERSKKALSFDSVSSGAARPFYQLDRTQSRVLALSNLYPDADCHPSQLYGRIVRRQFDNKIGSLVNGITVEVDDGRRTFVNVAVDLENLDMATRGWIVEGLQSLLKEGNRVVLGVKLCGAAGRVMIVDSIRRVQ